MKKMFDKINIKLKKLLLVLFSIFYLLLFATGCVYNSYQSGPPQIIEPLITPVNDYIPMARSVIISNNINDIIISGNINIKINSQQGVYNKLNKLLFQDSRDMRQHFHAYTQRGTLYLNYRQNPFNFSAIHNQAINIELTLQQPIQKLIIRGPGITHLTGDIIISNIYITDNALLYAYWINSANLHVWADKSAQVFLGGIAADIDLLARQNAIIEAQYLRADNAFVRTKNNAAVSVNVKNALSILSTENSTVYYYGHSRLKLSYLGNHGSALPLQKYY